MRSKVLGSFLLGLALVTTLSISARPPKPDHDSDGRDRDSDNRDRDNRNHDSAQCDDEQFEHNRKTPVSVIGVIPIPGNPVSSSDLIFADSGTEKVYFCRPIEFWRGRAGRREQRFRGPHSRLRGTELSQTTQRPGTEWRARDQK